MIHGKAAIFFRGQLDTIGMLLIMTGKNIGGLSLQ